MVRCVVAYICLGVALLACMDRRGSEQSKKTEDGALILLPATKPAISLAELRERYYVSGQTTQEREIQQGWIPTQELVVLEKNGNWEDNQNFRLHQYGEKITPEPVGSCAVKLQYDSFGLTVLLPKRSNVCSFAAYSPGTDWVTPSSIGKL